MEAHVSKSCPTDKGVVDECTRRINMNWRTQKSFLLFHWVKEKSHKHKHIEKNINIIKEQRYFLELGNSKFIKQDIYIF